MDGWLVHFEGRLDRSWVRVSGELHRLLPPATNDDEDDTMTLTAVHDVSALLINVRTPPF